MYISYPLAYCTFALLTHLTIFNTEKENRFVAGQRRQLKHFKTSKKNTKHGIVLLTYQAPVLIQCYWAKIFSFLFTCLHRNLHHITYATKHIKSEHCLNLFVMHKEEASDVIVRMQLHVLVLYAVFTCLGLHN